VAIETSVEYYLFTCARCGARWTEDYEVSEAVDDAGNVRSFYRYHGVSCEAPVRGNVECPNCHDTRSRRDPLYGTRPDFDPEEAGHPDLDPEEAGQVPAVPQPRAEEQPPQKRHRAAGTWHRFKFSAVVTLEAAGRSRRQYLSGVPGLMVHAPSCLRPARDQYFPAVIYTADGRPLIPGDRGVSVTISVPDDDASECFQSGQRFIVWDGTDIGHGTVGQRLSFFGRR
jgi:hypothetical protein